MAEGEREQERERDPSKSDVLWGQSPPRRPPSRPCGPPPLPVKVSPRFIQHYTYTLPTQETTHTHPQETPAPRTHGSVAAGSTSRSCRAMQAMQAMQNTPCPPGSGPSCRVLGSRAPNYRWMQMRLGCCAPECARSLSPLRYHILPYSVVSSHSHVHMIASHLAS